MLFFDGKKSRLAAQIKKEMTAAARAERFEEAAKLRNHLYALEHIRDVALISREDVELPYVRETREGMIDLEGRIEAYDISNISGTSAVGSMVVFEEGKPAKDEYRRFRIKTVRGSNDVAMLEEVMRRRLQHVLRQPPGAPLGKGGMRFPPARGGIKGGGRKRGWELPELMVIDGGGGQVNRVRHVLRVLGVRVPVIGIAKGFDRKQDRLVFDQNDVELARVATRGKELFQRARDEAHRFAVAYHRKLRGKLSLRGGTK
jgi:excinuclease ABC subunit C